MPWYAANRDLPAPPYGRTELYDSLEELGDRFADARRARPTSSSSAPTSPRASRSATGSCDTATGVTAFYDIDTPVTLAKLERGDREYLVARADPPLRPLPLVHRRPDAGAPGAASSARPAARPLYCSVDPGALFPRDREPRRWDLGYLGHLQRRPPAAAGAAAARAGPALARTGASSSPGRSTRRRSPGRPNVERIEHLPPPEHRAFYNAQRFTLNVTRADMIRAGYSPSVRLFEAAACGTPIISDVWAGLDTLLRPGRGDPRRPIARRGPPLPPRDRRGRARCADRPRGASAASSPSTPPRTARRELEELPAEQASRRLSRASRHPSEADATMTGRCKPTAPTRRRHRQSRDRRARPLVPQPAPARRRSRPRPTTPLGDFPRFKWQQIAPPPARGPDRAGPSSTSAATPASTASSSPAAARRSPGIDPDPHYLDQARWAAGAVRPGRTGSSSAACRSTTWPAATEQLRPRAVHGRLLPPALPAARPRHRRREGPAAAGLPDPDHARRGGGRRARRPRHRRPRRDARARAGRRWPSSSTAWPTTRPTGGPPTTPPSRRCSAPAACAWPAAPATRSTSAPPDPSAPRPDAERLAATGRPWISSWDHP